MQIVSNNSSPVVILIRNMTPTAPLDNIQPNFEFVDELHQLDVQSFVPTVAENQGLVIDYPADFESQMIQF